MNSKQVVEHVALKLEMPEEKVQKIYDAYWKSIRDELHHPTCQTVELRYLGTFNNSDKLTRTTLKHYIRKLYRVITKFEKTKVREKVKTEAIILSIRNKISFLKKFAKTYNYNIPEYDKTGRVLKDGVQGIQES